MSSIFNIPLIAGILLFLIGSYPLSSTAQAPVSDSFQIYFQVDRHEPAGSEKNRLIHFLSVLDFDRVDSIVLVGMADSPGSFRYNLALSQRRAQAVRQLLPSGIFVRVEAIGENGVHAKDSLGRAVSIYLYYRSAPAPADADPEPPPEPPPAASAIDTITVLNKILFEPNLPILTRDSELRLKAYLPELEKYKNRYIEVRGHVNHPYAPLKESDRLFQLSVNRAKLIYNYLIENGFNPALLRYRGMGNAEMRYPHPRLPEEQRENMRVELVVFQQAAMP